MSWPTFRITLRQRLPFTASVAAGLVGVQLAVGALFPAVGHTIGKLHIPAGVAQLLGGADYGTITGWFRGEIGSVYGPLVVAALATSAAAATTAGEEEDRIFALVLTHPITRSRLLISKAAAVAAVVGITALATWVGMIFGVALGGGGISLGHVTALAIHLAGFGLATGAVAIAVGGATGRRSLATGAAAAVGILGWLINGFAPLVGAVAWLKYLSFFFYYAGHDPLGSGVHPGDVAVLVAAAVLLAALGVAGIERRDLSS